MIEDRKSQSKKRKEILVSKQLQKIGFTKTDAVEGKMKFKDLWKDFHWDMICTELCKRNIEITPQMKYNEMKKLLLEAEGGANGFKPLFLTVKEWVEAPKQKQSRDSIYKKSSEK